MEGAAGITLDNGAVMPFMGLGTFQMASGGETERCVGHALEIGYRMLDTASMYGNEKDAGKAVRNSGLPREKVFVTTKLWNDDQGYEKALAAFEESADRLDLGYVDLYLIHWPMVGLRTESWKALERLYDEGRCRAIGVSNYTVRHLEELLGEARVKPAVNQVQLNPFCYQKDILDYCLANEIAVQAYCPLSRAYRLDDPRLGEIADLYGRTPAQMMIRWCIQKGSVPLPKTVHTDRMLENFDVSDFEISEEDMDRLDLLDEKYHVGWDPTEAP